MLRLMAVLVAFVIAVLWIFQVVLLDDFYQSITLREMKKTATDIASAAETDDFKTSTYNIAERFNSCVSVYKINGDSSLEIIKVHVQINCLIHNLSSDFNPVDIYNGISNTNYLIKTYFLGKGQFSNEDELNSGDIESIVLYKAVETTSGEKLLIVVNCESLPLSATKTVYVNQLLLISIIILLGAMMLAIIMSKFITKPMAQMSKQAEKLSHGDYDVKFEGGGFSESDKLADTLNYAASELSNLDKMQKELIENISHDLRTPLTMISGYAEVMRDIPGEVKPENLQVIIDETGRLSTLVNDLLDISKLNSGAVPLVKKEICITELITETMERYSVLVEHDGYSLDFIHDKDIWVMADRTRLLQVIYNLINNAINYAGDDKKIIVAQDIVGENVRISITDHGEIGRAHV